MMEVMDVLGQNQEFMMGAYGIGQFAGIIIILSILDVILKGFALWRAARMRQMYWFIALLIINSIGILPAIFLLMTNEQYKKHTGESQSL